VRPVTHHWHIHSVQDICKPGRKVLFEYGLLHSCKENSETGDPCDWYFAPEMWVLYLAATDATQGTVHVTRVVIVFNLSCD